MVGLNGSSCFKQRMGAPGHVFVTPFVRHPPMQALTSNDFVDVEEHDSMALSEVAFKDLHLDVGATHTQGTGSRIVYLVYLPYRRTTVERPQGAPWIVPESRVLCHTAHPASVTA